MKAKKLVDILDAYATVLELAGNETSASGVKALGKALLQKGGLEVSFVLEVVGDEPTGEADPLGSYLSVLALLEHKSGAKKFAIEFDAMSEVGKRSHLASSIEQLNVVRYFGKRLSAAPESLKDVQPIIKAMSAAGVLDAKQAVAIAATYVGGPSSYKNKKAALEAIRDRVARNEGLASKARMS